MSNYKNATLTCLCPISHTKFNCRVLLVKRSNIQVKLDILLPTGSGEHEVLYTGSTHVAILPSCQSFTIVHCKCIYLGSRNKKHLTDSTQVTIRPALTSYCPLGRGQYNGPNTASSVFLILIPKMLWSLQKYIYFESGEKIDISCFNSGHSICMLQNI